MGLRMYVRACVCVCVRVPLSPALTLGLHVSKNKCVCVCVFAIEDPSSPPPSTHLTHLALPHAHTTPNRARGPLSHT